MPKFKIGDKVVYDGKSREGCEHTNEEVGKIISTVNSATPYYLIEVLNWDSTPVYTIKHDVSYPLTWLAEEHMLKPWMD